MENKSIYDLELHERVYDGYNEFLKIVRVPGGWIYTVYEAGGTGSATSVFVPLDYEMKEQSP